MESSQKPIKILFQGDSITDGNRYKDPAQAWDLNHQMGHSYAYVINAVLGAKYPRRRMEFINRGISGNRIVDLYARVDSDILVLAPDVLSLYVGVNDLPWDFNQFTGTSGDKFQKLYAMLLEEVKARLPEAGLVLMEPVLFPDLPGRGHQAERAERVAEFQAAIKALARAFGAVHVPLQARFDTLLAVREPSYWCWDGIHPTENGHGIIAAEWMRAAKGVLFADTEESE